MAIIFLKQKKNQKILLGVFVAIVIFTLIIIWQGFSKKENIAMVEKTIVGQKKEVKIDFSKLASYDLQSLVSFPEIEPFKETASSTAETGEEITEAKIGRDNPFLPY